MHAAFIPYGKESEVDLLIADMTAQKHKLKLWKGKKVKHIWIQSQVRILPFGIYEYIFPKEDMDAVLNTLNFDVDRYVLGKLKLTALRKMIRFDKIPEFKKEDYYLWIKTHVQIIPLGIKHEGKNMIDPDGPNKGWEHEAI